MSIALTFSQWREITSIVQNISGCTVSDVHIDMGDDPVGRPSDEYIAVFYFESNNNAPGAWMCWWHQWKNQSKDEQWHDIAKNIQRHALNTKLWNRAAY